MTNGRLWITVCIICAQAESQNNQPAQQYLAFRPKKQIPIKQYEKMVKELEAMGIKTLHNDSLDYHRIVVFETPLEPKLKSTSKILSQLKSIPIQNFHGILSVHSGRMYVQFKETVSPEVVKSRLLEAGFRILTRPIETQALIAVEKSRNPCMKESEIEELQGLSDMLSVMPDDIPLPVRSPPYRGYRPSPVP